MAMVTITRDQRRCVLCKYWNGSIGSTTIQIIPGGNAFIFDGNEKHFCFKIGRGMQMMPLQQCLYFKERYES